MFKDRTDAGKQLVKKLSKYRGKKGAVVLALPRGGVVVGAEVAKELKLPLDIIVTRKIGHPENPEYAIAALGEHSFVVSESGWNFGDSFFEREVKNERREIKRRLRKYRGLRKPLNLKDKIAILVDDGVATGLTTIAAIEEVKLQKPKKIVVAIPVIPLDSVQKIRSIVNELVCIESPRNFWAVGQFYEEFNQTKDREVIEILQNQSENDENIDK